MSPNLTTHLRHCARHKMKLPCPVPGCASNTQKPAPDATSGMRKPPKKTKSVLVHYCFNQQGGETKNEHCKCEHRKEQITLDLAEEYVRDGLADWLVVKHPRAKSGTCATHRAIVIRQVTVEGVQLFAVSSGWKSKVPTRDEKHESIKTEIRDEAKDILRKLFAAGVIAQDVFQKLQTDAELDRLFTDKIESQKFTLFLADQKQNRAREQLGALLLRWWENVMGFYRMVEDDEKPKSINAGTIMKDAPSMWKGKLSYKDNHVQISDTIRGNTTVSPETFIPDPFSQEDRFIDNGGRDVPVANHMRKSWDQKGGANPHDYEQGSGQGQESPELDE